MIFRMVVLLSVLATTTHASSSAYAHWKVRPDGMGPVKIGMTRRQLGSVLHVKIRRAGRGEEESCYYSSPQKYPGVSFMIQNGRLARIDIDNPKITTLKGIHVGDTEADTISAYSQKLSIEPNHYSPEDHDLTLYSKDNKMGIKFETNEGKIANFYTGTTAAISLVEGCS